ncbi:MAG TPA: hypothetical protein VLK65_11100 [Vicinamibacteria bacterium]|nr:hypothetical protein [Vicinamibacteria bacterium]
MSSLVLAWATLLALPLAPGKPTEGKIRVTVVAETMDAEGNEKPNAGGLLDSAEEIRKRVKKMKWIEPVEEESQAEMHFVVVDRSQDKESGYALRYRLKAGDFEAEDDYGEFAVVEHAGGTPGIYDRQGGEMPMTAGVAMEHKQTYQSWKTIADGLARTLDHFAENNYDRLIAIRKTANNNR